MAKTGATNEEREPSREDNVPRRRLIGTIIVVNLLLSFARGLLGLFWTKQEAGQVFRNPKDLPNGILKQLDAVLVLGGGLPKSLEKPPVYVQRRCDDAAAVAMRHQEFHMERTKEIFDWIFGIGNNKYELFYLSSENVGLTDTGLRVRQEHEARGAKNVRQNLAPQQLTLKDVWAFLNQQHGLYTAAKLFNRVRTTGQRKPSDALKESDGGENQSKRR